MSTLSRDMRAMIVAGLTVVLLAAAIVSDFVVGSFWSKHAMVTSLLASLLVVVVSVAVINELLERRDRKRWSLLAQNVLFALVQSARLTWTAMIDLLGLAEVESGSIDSLLEGARIALDGERVSDATSELLRDPERRQALQRAVARLSTHASDVIARWASVMVGAAPYAGLLDRHVELQCRLEWLSSVLGHNEPAPDRGERQRRLNLSSIATENAQEFDDRWIQDMVVSITLLATKLDYGSRSAAFSLVSADWWTERTRSLADA